VNAEPRQGRLHAVDDRGLLTKFASASYPRFNTGSVVEEAKMTLSAATTPYRPDAAHRLGRVCRRGALARRAAQQGRNEVRIALTNDIGEKGETLTLNHMPMHI
jgi:hypothetical protein